MPLLLTALCAAVCPADACRDDTYDYNICRRMCNVRAYRQKSKGVCTWVHREGFGVTTHDCYSCQISRSGFL